MEVGNHWNFMEIDSLDHPFFLFPSTYHTHSPRIQFFAAVFYSGLRKRNVWCAAIFGGAALTDWFDGYLARTRGLETPFGAFLDPVADKVSGGYSYRTCIL